MKTLQSPLIKSCFVAALLLAAAPGADAATYQFYWFGTAGDGNWMNPENWSTTSDTYTQATKWPNSTSFDVFRSRF